MPRPRSGRTGLAPPQPVAAWAGVRDATRRAPSHRRWRRRRPAGPRSGAAEDWEDVGGAFEAVERAAPSEDCLNLNLWTPDPGARQGCR